ncbi:unnamed protein product [Acanthoscelides obtectus]|uniref:Ell-associated factor Eaf n=1 Tax=Acanthoscelides obtectus TaxID=200917 RepID=A0A9P0KRJ9_ACAOB|nr:unnamed protein product [Acanthoscelides obtectus]CAK1661924.1 Ell-associated factor Eaf [Acanthoscelides obtectus]
MAEKLGLGNEVRELKIGQSFTNPKSTAFHTVKYDFKPASVDTNKKATVDVAGNNQVTVTVPHLDGAGVPQTVFKGSQRPYQKECVLIIDRATGEITLEKLSYNIQVKKTRSEYNKLHQDRLSSSQGSNSGSGRSQTPPVAAPTPQRVSTKTRVTTSGRNRNNAERITTSIPHAAAKHSPLRASPSHQHRSPSMRDQVIPSPMSLSQPAMHLTNNELVLHFFVSMFGKYHFLHNPHVFAPT